MKNNLKTTLIIFTALLLAVGCKKKDPAPLEEGMVLNEEFNQSDDPFLAPKSFTDIRDGRLAMSYGGDDFVILDAAATRNAFSEKDVRQTVEVSVNHTAGHPYDKAIVYFNRAENGNYYAFSIGDKEFRIFYRQSGQDKNLITWTASPAIKGQLNQVNKLKITLADEKMQFFINETLVANVTAPGWKTLDRLGLGMAKAGTLPATYHFDYIKCWNK